MLVTFALGVQGLGAEQMWQAVLTLLGLLGSKIANLMSVPVQLRLYELNKLFGVLTAARLEGNPSGMDTSSENPTTTLMLQCTGMVPRKSSPQLVPFWVRV